MKKFLALILSLAVFFSMAPALAVPAAALGTFHDITDAQTAENVEVLRLMGVIDGVTDTSYQPNGSLTRAQFCKMAIVMMGKANLVGQYKSYTIFPDVRSSHWAAGYVNLAVKGENKFISGYPDGRFAPDDKITFGQAVTILVRLLGYTDSDVGPVWPDGYINTAAAIGLTDGLTLKNGDYITRAQAAKLFCSLLSTDVKDGASYAQSISSEIISDVILLSTNGVTDDGTPHSFETTEGTYKTANKVGSSLLEGRKGNLLLNSAGKVLTFVPSKAGTSKTITVSVAKAGYIEDSTNTKHTISGTAVAYYNGEQKTYADIFFNLRSGTAVTIYYNASGKAEYIFAGQSSITDAVIINGDGSTAGLSQLTNGSSDYTMYKNGNKATAADLKKYDVATYDPINKIMHICDTKLTGCYEDAYPNTEAPTSLYLLGIKFNVLPSAAASLSSFKIGDVITLLLTSDNQVAGVTTQASQTNSVGIVKDASADSATVELFCGLTVEGNPKLTDYTASQMVGRLVTVSSGKIGEIRLTRLASSGASAAFQVTEQKVGSTPLAENVRIFEQVENSMPVQIGLSDLTQSSIGTARISYVHLNYSGKVDILVLNDVTGDLYTYGQAVFTEASSGSGIDDYQNATVAVENSDGKSNAFECGNAFKDGAYIGIAPSANGKDLAKAITLSKLANVSGNAWNGNDSVTVNGTTYPVSDEIQCYNETTKKWVTYEAARAFSDKADLYYDRAPDEGGKIRILVVSQ